MKHQPRKRFGQNFLHDKNIIHKIIQSFQLRATDHVLEIGPGQGALTDDLIASVQQVDAIEIDRDLYQALLTKQQNHPGFKVHLQDALACELANYITQPSQKLRVVGNLPYNISTPLLFHLLTQLSYIEDMHFMLQKEVVQRMAAVADSSDYGRLSVMVQYHCQVDYLFTVPPTAFFPQPQVESAIVRLTPHAAGTMQRTDEATLRRLVTQAFNQRRKTIHNSLKDMVSDQQLLACGVNPSSRPQQLTVENFINLVNMIR